MLSLLLASAPLYAAVVRWDGGASTTAWSDAANWSGDQLPTAADDVVLDNTLLGGSYSVILTGLGYQIRSLTVGYLNCPNTLSLTIVGAGAGDNLRLGGAPGPDLVIADGGVVANQSGVTGAGNRGLEFVNSATDAWTMTGTGTYLHQQNQGSFLNVAAANVSFASTSTFELRSGLLSTWGGADGGLTVIKRYGNLKFNPTTAITLSLRVATDSLLVTGDLTLFNQNLLLHLSNNATTVRVHVLGDAIVTSARLFVSTGVSGAQGSRLVVDGDVITVGATARVGATFGVGAPKGTLVVGGSLLAHYIGSSTTNDLLSFWKPGSVTVSEVEPVSGSSFRKIDVHKAVVLRDDITLTGAADRLTVYEGVTFDCGPYILGGSGQFELKPGAGLRIGSPAGITAVPTLSGSIQTLGGRLFDADARYWYTGTSAQVTGSGLPAQVRDLAIATTPHSVAVSLTAPVTVTGNLTLTTGRLVLGNHDLTLEPAATITGGSATAFIRTGSSVATTGMLVRHVPATGVAVHFPVGTSTYTPASLKQTSGATPDNFRVRVFDGAYLDGTSGEPFAVNFVNRTWLVEEATAGGSNADLTLQWSTADEQPSFQRLSTRIRHYTNGAYDLAMANSSATGTDPYSLSREGLTSFSPFMVGDGTVPLPVELIAFTARPSGAGVQLNWSTASERNNDRFEVQRALASAPTEFRTIGTVAGHGTTTAPSQYEWLDQRVPVWGGMLYYRLRQVDTNGRSTYSDVRTVRPAAAGWTLTAYPNPATDRLTVPLSTPGAVVEVFDALGRRTIQAVEGSTELAPVAHETTSSVVLLIKHLPVGTYTLRVTLPDGSRQQQQWLKVE